MFTKYATRVIAVRGKTRIYSDWDPSITCWGELFHYEWHGRSHGKPLWSHRKARHLSQKSESRVNAPGGLKSGETLRKSLSDWHKKRERERWIERSGSKDWKDLFLFFSVLYHILAVTQRYVFGSFFRPEFWKIFRLGFFSNPLIMLWLSSFAVSIPRGQKSIWSFFCSLSIAPAALLFFSTQRNFQFIWLLKRGAKNNLIQSRRRRPEWMTFQSKKMTF